jgi:hypothetical protein
VVISTLIEYMILGAVLIYCATNTCGTWYQQSEQLTTYQVYLDPQRKHHTSLQVPT